MSEAHEDPPDATVVALQAAIDKMADDAKANPAAAKEAADVAALRDVLRRFAVPGKGIVGHRAGAVTCPDCRQANGKACTKHPKTKCQVCHTYMTPQHIDLDYVGHAEVTLILTMIDPCWYWEPMGTAPDGSPIVRDAGNMLELWGKLYLFGRTRGPAVGTLSKKAAGGDDKEVAKELISDFLRNAALRFGVAVSLWSKGEWDMDAIAGPAEHHEPPPERATSRPVPERAAHQRGELAYGVDPRPLADQGGPAPTAAQTAPSAPPVDPKDWVAMALAEACSTGHGRARLLSAARDMAREAGVDLPKSVDDVRTHPMAEQFAAWAAENLHAQAS